MHGEDNEIWYIQQRYCISSFFDKAAAREWGYPNRLHRTDFGEFHEKHERERESSGPMLGTSRLTSTDIAASAGPARCCKPHSTVND
jgi:hypothetical protein